MVLGKTITVIIVYLKNIGASNVCNNNIGHDKGVSLTRYSKKVRREQRGVYALL